MPADRDPTAPPNRNSVAESRVKRDIRSYYVVQCTISFIVTMSKLHLNIKGESFIKTSLGGLERDIPVTVVNIKVGDPLASEKRSSHGSVESVLVDEIL